MKTVIFVDVEDMAELVVEKECVYIGDLLRRGLYPPDSAVCLFASFTALTATLSPLLLLSEFPEIRVQTGVTRRAISIISPIVLSDIDERIAEALHGPPSLECIYRTILGECVVEAHDCADHL